MTDCIIVRMSSARHVHTHVATHKTPAVV